MLTSDSSSPTDDMNLGDLTMDRDLADLLAEIEVWIRNIEMIIEQQVMAQEEWTRLVEAIIAGAEGMATRE